MANISISKPFGDMYCKIVSLHTIPSEDIEELARNLNNWLVNSENIEYDRLISLCHFPDQVVNKRSSL